MKVSIFCSANHKIDPDFFSMTEELGRWLVAHGHSVVFGGCNLGLMECIAKSVKEAGGQTIGVIPRLIEERGAISEYVDVEIFCDNLSDRKELMLLHSDIAIALPGGIGTLDEIFTMASAHTIGYHHKPVILYNMKGFWDKTLEMLDDLQARGFIRGDYHEIIIPADGLEELARQLAGYRA